MIGRVAALSLVASLTLLSGANGAPAKAPALDTASLAGVYKHSFANGLVDGTSYTSENILEIVPLTPTSAYFRTHLEFYNGHTCAVWGVAHVEGQALVYKSDLGMMDADGRPLRCTFRIALRGKALALEDPSGGCRVTCGARGGYSGIQFARQSRRPIRYLARLKASSQFAQALAEDTQR